MFHCIHTRGIEHPEQKTSLWHSWPGVYNGGVFKITNSAEGSSDSEKSIVKRPRYVQAKFNAMATIF